MRLLLQAFLYGSFGSLKESSPLSFHLKNGYPQIETANHIKVFDHLKNDHLKPIWGDYSSNDPKFSPAWPVSLLGVIIGAPWINRLNGLTIMNIEHKPLFKIDISNIIKKFAHVKARTPILSICYVFCFWQLSSALILRQTI